MNVRQDSAISGYSRCAWSKLMSKDDVALKPRVREKTKVERPKLYKVILFNDDFTPREFVVMVLKYVFKTGADAARKIMLTAHMKGSCVVAVYTRDIAETKVKEAMDLAREGEYPLLFTAEPEE
jgi:ATP-dependent Clp protease adaptor protein ClpS